MFEFEAEGATAIVVIDKIAADGDDKGGQRLLGQHLISGQQTQECILDKVFGLVLVTKATAGVCQQLASVKGVIV